MKWASEEEAISAWERLEVDVKGMTFRQAMVKVADVSAISMGVLPEAPTEKQLEMLAKYGYSVRTKRFATAVRGW